MFERILVSVDGSPNSDKAVQVSEAMARAHNSRVLVVHGRDVATPIPMLTRPPSLVSDQLESEEFAQRLVDDAVARLQAAGLDVRGEVLAGPGKIGVRILAAAEAAEADLIILGSRGMSAATALLIGSVAHRVIHEATCPVLLAR